VVNSLLFEAMTRGSSGMVGEDRLAGVELDDVDPERPRRRGRPGHLGRQGLIQGSRRREGGSQENEQEEGGGSLGSTAHGRLV